MSQVKAMNARRRFRAKAAEWLRLEGRAAYVTGELNAAALRQQAHAALEQALDAAIDLALLPTVATGLRVPGGGR